MRVLIIDNYDSFTYNIRHLVSELIGEPVDVVKNDKVSWNQIRNIYDAIIISPGPGHPGIERDVGITPAILREYDRPLLGVCLGHQSLCLSFGSRIRLAPEPFHGRESQIHHRGTGIFESIPSPFQAVRYHSLAAYDIGPELEVDAWTSDDIVMAVHHRSRPFWGVQFHPESIATEYGARLLSGFLRSAGCNIEGSRRLDRFALVRGETSASSIRRSAPEQRENLAWHVRSKRLPLMVDAALAFNEIYGTAETAVWLDSSDAATQSSRFSVMAGDSGPHCEEVIFRVGSDSTTVKQNNASIVRSGNIYEHLERKLAARHIASPDLPFDFNLGFVGYLGYEMKALSGGSAVHQSLTPDARFLYVDRALVFDHEHQCIYLLCLERSGEGLATTTWFQEIEDALRKLANSKPTKAEASLSKPAFEFRHDSEKYLDLVNACREFIRRGESYEVCLTNFASASTSISTFETYLALRKVNPAPYSAFLRFGGMCVLSSSPECFLKIDRNRTIRSKPIKGTARRGKSPAEDDLLRRDLSESIKDRSENMMITDLTRNDLSQVSEIGSVRVPSLFAVESYARVHHLVSTITGQLRPDVSAVQAIRHIFPGGSMTGAPKMRTMEIIDGLEDGPRGVYSGALGYLSHSGCIDLSIIIRTLVTSEDRVTFGSGGAVVWLSDPREELNEVALKAASFVSATFENKPSAVSDLDGVSDRRLGLTTLKPDSAPPTVSQAAVNDELTGLRQSLDEIDHMIVETLGRRFELIRQIGELKRDQGVAVMQPMRVAEVKARCAAIGLSRGLRSEFVEELYEFIIQEACRLEAVEVEHVAAQ